MKSESLKYNGKNKQSIFKGSGIWLSDKTALKNNNKNTTKQLRTEVQVKTLWKTF